jgi:DNA modification methylase
MTRATLIAGDCRDAMRTLPDESVHCVVTSPPYFGLRDYGVAGQVGLESRPDCLGWATGERCGSCFVCVMVDVFREVWRVLRSDGCVWLNLGDSFANDGKWGGATSGKHASGLHGLGIGRARRETGLKPKDLCMIPHRVALALQADGWWVRGDNVWSKPNPMPEPVTDRATRSHEYVFQLAKSARYYYDAEAVREDATAGPRVAGRNSRANVDRVPRERKGEARYDPTTAPGGRNRRSVWTITPKSFPEAHFATFPQELAEVCVKAGTSERGCCPMCAAPFVRVVAPTPEYARLLGKDWANYEADAEEGRGHFALADGGVSGQRCVKRGAPSVTAAYVTTGWRPGCDCAGLRPLWDLPERDDYEESQEWELACRAIQAGNAARLVEYAALPVSPCVVLDPFSGAATSGVVAGKLGRDYIGCELNPAYVEMSERRILREVGPLLVTVDIVGALAEVAQ